MRYQSFLRKSTYWRYGVFILTIFFSYYSIQAFINNKTIDNFYQNYLKGEYSSFFLGHENGQLYRSERIVRVKQRSLEDEETYLPEVDKEIDLTELSPQESRARFIERRLTPLKDLWIIQ